MKTPKTDINNKPYALLSQTKPGDYLISDEGFISDDRNVDGIEGVEFHCIKPNRKCLVKYHETGLYVTCGKGKHFLEGQLDFEDNDSLIGFYPNPPAISN